MKPITINVKVHRVFLNRLIGLYYIRIGNFNRSFIGHINGHLFQVGVNT